MANCELCGEPLPAGEEMFKYHGYSGDCPKPPLPKPMVVSVIEYIFRDTTCGKFYLDIHVDRKPYVILEPFNSADERQRAHDDLLQMMRSQGAIDIPNREQ